MDGKRVAAPDPMEEYPMETEGERKQAALAQWWASPAATTRGSSSEARHLASVVNTSIAESGSTLSVSAAAVSLFLKQMESGGGRDAKRVAVETEGEGKKKSTRFVVAPPPIARKNPWETSIDSRRLARLETKAAELKVAVKEIGVLEERVAELEGDAQRANAHAGAANGEVLKKAAKDGKAIAAGKVVGGARSLELKVAVAEIKAICPGVSFNQLPMIMGVLMLGFVAQLGLVDLVPLEVIASVIPSPSIIGSWVTECGELSEYLLLEERGNIRGAYASNDHGDKGGKELLVEIYTFWDHEAGRAAQFHASCAETGKDADAVRARMLSTMARFEIDMLFGTCTDSATSAISGLVKALRVDYPNMNAVGCWLHILSLMLLGGIYAGFGEEERGKCSALRIAFMCPYLINKFYGEYVEWGKTSRPGEALHRVALGEKGRWWSILQGLGDILRVADTLSDFFMHQANRMPTSSAYQPLFREVSAWLKNPKVLLDMRYIHTFCTDFYVPAMQFVMDADEEQLQWEETKHQIKGLRAARMTRMVICWHWQLEKMREDGLGGANMAGVRQEMETNCPEFAEAFALQVDTVLLEVNSLLEKHGHRWLTELVDTACADHSSIARHTTARLVAVYRGDDLPVIPNTEMEMDGHKFMLRELVQDMCQKVTAEELEENSVLFCDVNNVQNFELVLEHGFDFEKAGGGGASLLKEICDKIKSMPIQNLVSEKAVQSGGNQAAVKYGRGLDSSRADVLFLTRENRILVERMDAVDSYLEMAVNASRTKSISSSFRSRGQPVRRERWCVCEADRCAHVIG